MTLGELIRSGYGGYFYYNPAQLKQRQGWVHPLGIQGDIPASVGACTQNMRKPSGWETGLTHAIEQDKIFVNFEKGSVGPHLSLVQVNDLV